MRMDLILRYLNTSVKRTALACRHLINESPYDQMIPTELYQQDSIESIEKLCKDLQLELNFLQLHLDYYKRELSKELSLINN